MFKGVFQEFGFGGTKLKNNNTSSRATYKLKLKFKCTQIKAICLETYNTVTPKLCLFLWHKSSK